MEKEKQEKEIKKEEELKDLKEKEVKKVKEKKPKKKKKEKAVKEDKPKKEKKKKEKKVKVKKSKKTKKENKNKFEETDELYEETSKGKYVFIYFFMFIMIIALIGLVFVILNEKFLFMYKNPIATIELEDFGKIKIELEPLKAPNTVNHFIKLVESGYYDGKVVYGKDAVSLHFGRTKKGGEEHPTVSMVDNTIEEGSDLDYEYEIDGEFERNNFKGNDIKHQKYVVSLVRADYSNIMEKIQHYSYNAGTGMFKILFEDAPGMDGNYAAFGRVIDGEEIIDQLTGRKLRFEPETEEDKADLNEFNKFVTIKSITVDTFGRKFKDVKLHKRFSLEEFIVQLYESFL